MPRKPRRPAWTLADVESAARVFALASNANRLGLMIAMAADSPTVSQLRSAVPLTESAASKHLAVLRKGGAAVAEGDKGKVVAYRLTPRGRAILAAFQAFAALHRQT